MAELLTALSETALRKAMYKRIKEQIDAVRSGRIKAKRVILVVPAQSTLMTEIEGFKELGGEGFFDFLVMSGAKLRENILNECGYPGVTPINTIGRNMLLRKIVKDNSDNLELFKSVSLSEGFLDMAGDFIVQLKQNDMTADDLGGISKSIGSDSILSDKLNDLRLICSEYESSMAGKFSDSEDLLAFTSEKVQESSYIKESVIWYYGFYSFTKREYVFLQALKDNAAGFGAAVISGENRYITGSKTVSKLKAMGLECCSIEESEKVSPLCVMQCSSIYKQSMSIACDILRRHRDEGVSYSDIAVLTQDLGEVGESIKHVFQSLEIPYFMDEKQSMQYSPAARIISHCLNIAVCGFRRQDVIGLLKTGILDFEEQHIEMFENYVRQYKVFDKAFLKSFKYGRNDFSEGNFAKLEEMRAKLQSVFETFTADFCNASLVREKTEVLYIFLTETLHLPEYLEKAESEYSENMFFDAADEFSQSWEFITGLFDQMVELIGGDELSGEEYVDLLLQSFADVKIGILPQGQERVRIGSVTRSALSDVRVLYIAGFNDGIIPSDSSSDMLLTESELDLLSSSGIELAKNSSALADEEMFQIEKILDTPCDELIISYCNSNTKGDAMMPSSLLEDIKASHPGFTSKQDLSEDDYIQNKKSLLSKLPQSVKGYCIGEDMPESYKYSYNLACTDLADDFTGSLFFRPYAAPLGNDTASDIFSKNGREYYSPTQLEKYAECPFKHFVDYGLKAEKIREFGVDSVNFGTICHYVLENISKKLTSPCTEKHIRITDASSPWMVVSMDDIDSMVKDLAENMKGDLLDGLLEFDSANQYRTERIIQACSIFAKQMVLQVQKGKIDSMMFESYFGEYGNLPPVRIETPFGVAVIEGKIDRADLLPSDGSEYVKIIDYKSGSKEFNIDKVREGLDLQLMIYFESILGKDRSYKPGGVFYYKIKDIESSLDYINLISDELADDFLLQNAGNFALDGIVINDAGLLNAMDKGIVDTEKIQTDVFATKKNKRIITNDEMEDLRSVFKDKLSSMCAELKSGNVSIKPTVFNKTKVGCSYCDYSSICLISLEER